jgi:hypothetical protein
MADLVAPAGEAVYEVLTRGADCPFFQRKNEVEKCFQL